MRIKTASALFLVAVWSIGLYGQSDLVTLQKKERERRKNSKQSVLLLTNEKIAVPKQAIPKNRYSATIMRTSDEAGAQPASIVDTSLTESSVNGEQTSSNQDSDSWLNQSLALQDAISQQKEKIQRLQSHIDTMIASRMTEANPVAYQELQQQIISSQETLTVEKDDLAAKEKEYADFLAQARREGIPAGWLRR